MTPSSPGEVQESGTVIELEAIPVDTIAATRRSVMAEPAPGSLMLMAIRWEPSATPGRSRFFCSSLPITVMAREGPCR